MNDEFHGVGGSYIIKDGKRVRVEDPTAPTDTGGARDAEGKPVDSAPAAAVNETPRSRRTAAPTE